MWATSWSHPASQDAPLPRWGAEQLLEHPSYSMDIGPPSPMTQNSKLPHRTAQRNTSKNRLCSSFRICSAPHLSKARILGTHAWPAILFWLDPLPQNPISPAQGIPELTSLPAYFRFSLLQMPRVPEAVPDPHSNHVLATTNHSIDVLTRILVPPITV